MGENLWGEDPLYQNQPLRTARCRPTRHDSAAAQGRKSSGYPVSEILSFFQSLDQQFVLVVNHLAVKLPELQ
jgi:hypothetical protein